MNVLNVILLLRKKKKYLKQVCDILIRTGTNFTRAIFTTFSFSNTTNTSFFTVTFVAIAWVGKDFGCTQFPSISGVILASSSHS